MNVGFDRWQYLCALARHICNREPSNSSDRVTADIRLSFKDAKTVLHDRAERLAQTRTFTADFHEFDTDRCLSRQKLLNRKPFPFETDHSVLAGAQNLDTALDRALSLEI